MKNIEEINRSIVKKILEKKKIPEFFAGDTVKVGFSASRCHLFDSSKQAFR